MDKEALINYISKLNDRNLQRQQASGFTLWAILGVIAYLILDLSDKIPLVYYSPELKFYSIIIFAGSFNFFYLIFLLIISLILGSDSSDIRRRFSSTIDSKSSPLFILPMLFVNLVLLIINLKASSIVTSINISPLIFWIFSLFFASNLVLTLIMKMYKLRKSDKVRISYPEISLSKKMRLFYSIFLSITSIVGLILLYFVYQDISLPFEANQISVLLKISIEISTFFILIVIFFDRIRSSNKFEWLENLEKEIYLDNLDESEIKDKLEREYIGLNVFKWISKSEEKLNTVATELLHLLKEENSKMDDLKEVNGISQFEMREERRIDICNNVKKKFEEYKSVCDETIFQLTEIERQGFLDKDEQMNIEKVTKEWASQLKDIERQYKEFCNCCQHVCS